MPEIFYQIKTGGGTFYEHGKDMYFLDRNLGRLKTYNLFIKIKDKPERNNNMAYKKESLVEVPFSSYNWSWENGENLVEELCGNKEFYSQEDLDTILDYCAENSEEVFVGEIPEGLLEELELEECEEIIQEKYGG